MASQDDTPARVRWARLRFQIIGPLFAARAVHLASDVRNVAHAVLPSRATCHMGTVEMSSSCLCLQLAKVAERWRLATVSGELAVELLAHDAPDALIEAALAAAEDEMVRARISADLASRYLGARVWPTLPEVSTRANSRRKR